jgi:hypothetical protein
VPGRPPLNWTATRLLAVAGAALLLLLVVASQCQTPGVVEITPPTGESAGCSDLGLALPEQVNGQGRRRTTPESDRTDAWGTPAVVLRCGVDRPAGLTASSEVIEVNGVGWFFEEQQDAYVFTTVGRDTYIEVQIPLGIPREQATGPLVDLARPIKRNVPLS